MERPISKIEFFNMVKNIGPILEIGPYASPIYRRPEWNVKYADIFTAEQIKEQCIACNKDYTEIPNCIDILVDVNAQPTLTADIKFTTIFSSHNIEHHPDLINHLKEVADIAEAGANFYIAIPDKRYCLDHWHNETTVADVLIAHIEKRKKHNISTYLNNILFTTPHNTDESIHWIGDHGPNLKLPKINDEYINKIKHGVDLVSSHHTYVDQHCWYFTPQTFEHIFTLLEKLNYSDWHLTKVYNTRPGSHEFYAVLTKK